MQDEAEPTRLALLSQRIANHSTLLRICGIHIEKQGLAAVRLDTLANAFGLRQRRAPVQMHSQDVIPPRCHVQSHRGPEAAGRSENQCPSTLLLPRLFRHAGTLDNGLTRRNLCSGAETAPANGS